MASITKAQKVVSQVRDLATEVVSLTAKVKVVTSRYDNNGGEDFIAPFFVSDDGVTERTDLDVTQAQIVACLEAFSLMSTWLESKLSIFNQAE